MLTTTYSLESLEIGKSDVVRDLGIMIQSNLRFNTHCSRITAKAFSLSRNIRICFQGHSVGFYINIFKTYVRPLVESNIAAFSPITLESIDSIENVQKRFTKYLPGSFDLSYPERLRVLKLEPLEERRIVIDLVLLFKIVSSKVPLKPLSHLRLRFLR